MHSLCIKKDIQDERNWALMIHRSGTIVHTSTKAKSQSQTMPWPGNIKSSTDTTSPHGMHSNAIFSKLANEKYLTLVNVGSGHHNLKLD